MWSIGRFYYSLVEKRILLNQLSALLQKWRKALRFSALRFYGFLRWASLALSPSYIAAELFLGQDFAEAGAVAGGAVEDDAD